MPSTPNERRDRLSESTVSDVEFSRRGLLQGTAMTAFALGFGVFATDGAAIAVGLESHPQFLTAAELKVLSAVVDRVVPGQPEDLAVGAVQTGCPAAIDGLLAAFDSTLPKIFAGVPYSNRGGSRVNYFEEFLPLDPYEARAWRLRIEGDPAHGVDGFQQIYRRGLAALTKSNPLFAALPGPVRDLALHTTNNADIAAMRDLAATHTLEFYLAAPEYGGNGGLGGWKAVGFDGDTQPRGFTEAEIDNPPLEMLPLLPMPVGNLLGGLLGSLFGTVTATVSDLVASLPTGPAGVAVRTAAPALALSTAEGMQSVGAAGTDHANVQKKLGSLLDPLKSPHSEASVRMRNLHDRAAALVLEAKTRGK